MLAPCALGARGWGKVGATSGAGGGQQDACRVGAAMVRCAGAPHLQFGEFDPRVGRRRQRLERVGGAAGDALLKEASLRLRASVRTYDTVARLGGDEFGMLLPKIHTGSHLARVAGQKRTALNKHILLSWEGILIHRHE